MPRPPAVSTVPARLSWIVMGAALLVVAITVGDYGITWDEGPHSLYGEQVVRYFASGFRDTSCNELGTLYLYGPLADLVPALVARTGDAARFAVRHMFLGLVAVLSLPGLWLFARLLRNDLVALFAVVAVVMMPRYYGHWFNNSKDVPLAVAVVWFFSALGSWCIRPDRWRRAAGLGVALGVALCVRPGIMPLAAAFFVAAAVLSAVTGQAEVSWRRAWPTLAGRVAAVWAVAWVVMVLPWPYAHANPLLNPLRAAAAAMSFPHANPVLFDGQVMDPATLPRIYLVKFIVITTPPTIGALAVAGLALMVRAQIAAPRSRASFVYGLVQVWLFVPVAGFTILKPTIYDGLRHFLFVLPAIAVMAAVGAAGVIELCAGRARWIAWPAVVALLLLPVKDLVRLHPYQMTYFNALVGGTGGADGRYETDYWASSYREAMLWINEQVERRGDRVTRVVVCGSSFVRPLATEPAGPFIEVQVNADPDRLEWPEGADYCVATYRYGFAANAFPDAPVLHTVGRDGATFAVIKGPPQR